MPDDEAAGPARFEARDLAGAHFEDVNLASARFRECNLMGATMTGVVLTRADIDGVIDGLVVNGVEVAPLIEAELDRRDPRRVELRPTDDGPCGFALRRTASGVGRRRVVVPPDVATSPLRHRRMVPAVRSRPRAAVQSRWAPSVV